jgi:hypothetical protein
MLFFHHLLDLTNWRFPSGFHLRMPRVLLLFRHLSSAPSPFMKLDISLALYQCYSLQVGSL